MPTWLRSSLSLCLSLSLSLSLSLYLFSSLSVSLCLSLSLSLVVFLSLSLCISRCRRNRKIATERYRKIESETHKFFTGKTRTNSPLHLVMITVWFMIFAALGAGSKASRLRSLFTQAESFCLYLSLSFLFSVSISLSLSISLSFSLSLSLSLSHRKESKR